MINIDTTIEGSLPVVALFGLKTNKDLTMEKAPTGLTAGDRQGAISLSLDRTSGYALTSWDGNPDCGFKMSVYNSAVNGTNGATRGFDVTVRNNVGATESWINGMALTAENKTGAGTLGSAITAQFNLKNNGVISTSNYGVVIQDQSQGTNPADTAMLRITTGADSPASGPVPAVINIAAKDSAGFTNLIYAESTTLDCATVGAGTYSTADGYFTIKVGANTYRMPFFTAVD